MDWMIWKIAEPQTTNTNNANIHGPTGYFSISDLLVLGTFPLLVTFLLAFSLATRIRCDLTMIDDDLIHFNVLLWTVVYSNWIGRNVLLLVNCHVAQTHTNENTIQVNNNWSATQVKFRWCVLTAAFISLTLDMSYSYWH